MLLQSWLVSPLDGAVAMLVLLRPWTSTAHKMVLPSSLVLSQGRGWFDLLMRAWTSTDFLGIRWIWCARSASTGDQPALTPSLSGVPPSASARTDQADPPPYRCQGACSSNLRPRSCTACRTVFAVIFPPC